MTKSFHFNLWGSKLLSASCLPDYPIWYEVYEYTAAFGGSKTVVRNCGGRLIILYRLGVFIMGNACSQLALPHPITGGAKE